MNIDELMVRLQIEKDNRNLEKKTFNPVVTKDNIVEHCQTSKIYKNKLSYLVAKGLS